MNLGYFTFILTEKCNEKCHYCDIPQLNKPKHIDLDIFDKYIDQIVDLSIKHNKIIKLTGGEPGLLNEKTLSHIFSKLPVKVEVNTNGLWFKKGYDKLFKDQIKRINYHVVDINNYIDYKSECNILYELVLDNKNFDNIYNNLDKINGKYNLNAYFAKNGDLSKLLNNNQFTKLGYNNFLDRIKEFKKLKCINSTRTFDFVNGTIKDCCMSYTLSPSCKMTKENINVKTSNYLCSEYIICNHCEKKYKNTFRIKNILKWYNFI